MKTIHNNTFGSLKFLALLLAAGLVLWGCDQGTPDTETMQKSQSSTSAMPAGVMSAAVANQQASLSGKGKATNKQLRAVSRALAKALAEKELRQYVYDRAMEKFDGETNVLWSQLANPEQGKNAPGGKSWNALIKNHLPPGKARGMAHKFENTIDRASRFLGGPVHLYWANAEDFSKSNVQAPLVTFTPLGANADEITDIVAYDASGEEHVVNGQTAKERPVIVITYNERVDRAGNVQSGLGASTNATAIEEPGTGGGGGGGGDYDGGGSGGGGDSGYSDRGCNPSGGYTNDLRLDYAEFHAHYEGWTKGDPEFRARFTRYESPTKKMETIDQYLDLAGEIPWEEAEDGVTQCFNGGKILLDWHTDDYYAYHFQWVEEDGREDRKLIDVDGPFSIPTPWGDASVENFDVTAHHYDNELASKMVYLEDLKDNPEQEQAYQLGNPDFKLTLVK